MSFGTFYSNLTRTLQSRFPSTKDKLGTFEIDRLISPHQISLPRSIQQRAEQVVAAHYRLANNESIQRDLLNLEPWLTPVPATPTSLLTAYDFHTNEKGEMALIEVNTNASAYLLALSLYWAHGIDPKWNGISSEASLKAAFARRDGESHLTLVDDQIEEQKMYIEFVMYMDWLKGLGWQTDICEAKDLVFSDHLFSPRQERIDFVYNRTTDFYFDTPEHVALRNAYTSNSVRISPHPWAYLLLADKERLVDLRNKERFLKAGISEEDLGILSQVLLPTYELNEIGSAEEVWARRKNLFFKPRNSHGGKSVYRGSSVSRKVFERIVAEEFLAQEFMPAQNYPVGDSDTYLENWKFDLRFYVYEEKIQLAVARLYQGQVTNFSSQFGGLTAVSFID